MSRGAWRQTLRSTANIELAGEARAQTKLTFLRPSTAGMDLETARGLKQELLSFIDQIRVPRRDGVGGRRERKPELAVGFAPTDRHGNIHIAVRAESEEELPRSVVNELRLRTKHQIDIRYTGQIMPLVDPLIGPFIGPTTRPLAIGASIAHYRCGAGTLGFFARRLSDGAIGIVSNNHVLAAADQGKEHDEILQPAPGDNGTRTCDVVAYLSKKYPRLRRRSARLDCAFAPLADGMQFNPAPAGHPLAPTLAVATTKRTMVSKIGRTTCQTFGRVTAFELDTVRVTYPFGRIAFNGQIEIEPTRGVPFSRPGDSGSLVFTVHRRQPLGLIFGCSLRGGKKGLGLTFANPIGPVLVALGVTLIT